MSFKSNKYIIERSKVEPIKYVQGVECNTSFKSDRYIIERSKAEPIKDVQGLECNMQFMMGMSYADEDKETGDHYKQMLDTFQSMSLRQQQLLVKIAQEEFNRGLSEGRAREKYG